MRSVDGRARRRHWVSFLRRVGSLPAVLLLACAPSPPASPEVGAARGVRTGAPVVLERACTVVGPERCFNAADDNCNGLIDEGCGGRTGLLQFTIAWGDAQADVDLEVTDPNGELAEIGRTTQSGLTKERDCPGANDQCQGQNTENVYLEEGDPLRGQYRVRVRLERLGRSEPPLEVTLGGRLGPKTFAAQVVLTTPGQTEELKLTL